MPPIPKAAKTSLSNSKRVTAEHQSVVTHFETEKSDQPLQTKSPSKPAVTKKHEQTKKPPIRKKKENTPSGSITSFFSKVIPKPHVGKKKEEPEVDSILPVEPEVVQIQDTTITIDDSENAGSLVETPNDDMISLVVVPQQENSRGSADTDEVEPTQTSPIKASKPAKETIKNSQFFPEEGIPFLLECIAQATLAGSPKTVIVDKFQANESFKDVPNREISLKLLFYSFNRKIGTDISSRWWIKKDYLPFLPNDLKLKVEKLAKSFSETQDGDGDVLMTTQPGDNETVNVPTPQPVEEDPRIAKYQSQCDALVLELRATREKVAPPTKDSLITREEADINSSEMISTFAGFVQDQVDPVSTLACMLHAVYSQFSVEDLENKIKILAERKSYGLRPKNAIAACDTDEDAIWRWEILNLDLLSRDRVKAVSSSRKSLLRLSRNLHAVEKMLQLLQKNNAGSCETKISKQEEIVFKYMREDELKRQKQTQKEEAGQLRQAKKLEAEQKKLETEQKKLEEKQKKENEKLELKRVRESMKTSKELARSPKRTKAEKKANPASTKLTSFFSTKVATASASEFTLEDDIIMIDTDPVDTKEQFEAFEKELVSGKIDENWLCTIRKHHLNQLRKLMRKQAPKHVQSDDDVLAAKYAKKKLFQFYGNRRPAYFGTFRKTSKVVSGKTPFAQDPLFDYSVDSDDEWQDEPEDAESIAESDVDSEEGDPADTELDYQDGWLLADDTVEYDRANANTGDGSDVDDADMSSRGIHTTRIDDERVVLGVCYPSDEGTKDPKNGFLNEYTMSFFTPTGETTTTLDTPLELPSKEMIDMELLSKRELKTLSQAQAKAAEAAAAAAAIAESTVAPASTTTGDTSPAPNAARRKPLPPFPEDAMPLLVKVVNQSNLSIKQIIDNFQGELQKQYALEFSKLGYGEVKSVPPKNRSKEKVLEIATKIRQPENKFKWVVHEAVLKKYVAESDASECESKCQTPEPGVTNHEDRTPIYSQSASQ